MYAKNILFCKMSIQCRTCAEKFFNTNAKNLFKQEDNEILLNIEILTGIKITEDQYLPMHICTCCHLELYHSIAFRERCLKANQFLQTAKQKQMTLDPLKAANVETHPPKSPLNQPPCPNEIILTDDPIQYIPDTEKPSHHSSQSQELRSRKQNLQKSIDDRNECSLTSDSDELTPAMSPSNPNITHHHESPRFKNSSRGSPSICVTNCSSSSEDQNELSGLEETSDFHDPVLQAVSPASKSDNSPQVTQLLTEQEDGTIRKKEKQPGVAKVFICDLCGHQSSNPKNLDIHILRHKGEKNFECTECGTKHYSKYLLQLHIRVKHQGERPFVCRFCGQRFYSGSTRQRHEQVRHIRSLAYECKICGKKYNTKSCLNKHEFLHSGLRPYRCDLCNVAFPRKPGLRIHCRTKQHQKRASEALNSSQLTEIKEIAVLEEAIILPESIVKDEV